MLKDALQGLFLSNVWHERHPDSLAYSCYTPATSIFSRLDYCFLTPELISHVIDVTYLTQYLSDRFPLLMPVGSKPGHPRIPLWRLRAEALKDPPYVQTLRAALTNYFAENGDREAPGPTTGRR
ncbi:hypothetical protein NDU88_004427 [Pleurodeles waltl]|uniref:Uncharacterized protein n=1 Tax=Pleurodeles waltl TaxID=8319 RepID=A0AAV7TRU5_PLEWA|nr:hypothetical protein NDU88_004427 [Pleurodeles waltl]